MSRPKPFTGPRCKAHCPGGHSCTLDTSPAHDLHICADERCYCHTQARYLGVPAHEAVRTGRRVCRPAKPN